MDKVLLEELRNIPILCVEDEDGIREVIVDTLKYYFDEVYEARDGEEGYEIYLDYKPKIILSDIQMKNCDGIEFVKKIRKDDHNTTIIMLTAYSNEEYLMDLINLNVNHFILKPLNLKKLTEALLKYLNKNLEPISLSKDLLLDLQKKRSFYIKETNLLFYEKERRSFYIFYMKEKVESYLILILKKNFGGVIKI